ncbi:hypothetical protein Tco_1439253 [Tanacetum coccineum]
MAMVARGHGGDNGSSNDDRLWEPPSIHKSFDAKLIKKFEDGKKKISIDFDLTDQNTTKPVGDNNRDFTGLIGNEIERSIPFCYESWEVVPDKYKGTLWLAIHVCVGGEKTIPVTNTSHSILPTLSRPLYLHNVLDFLTCHILLRCDSSGDLYPVTKPSPTPSALISISPSTWHQRLGHPAGWQSGEDGDVGGGCGDEVVWLGRPVGRQPEEGATSDMGDRLDRGMGNNFWYGPKSSARENLSGGGGVAVAGEVVLADRRWRRRVEDEYWVCK